MIFRRQKTVTPYCAWALSLPGQWLCFCCSQRKSPALIAVRRPKPQLKYLRIGHSPCLLVQAHPWQEIKDERWKKSAGPLRGRSKSSPVWTPMFFTQLLHRNQQPISPSAGQRDDWPCQSSATLALMCRCGYQCTKNSRAWKQLAHLFYLPCTVSSSTKLLGSTSTQWWLA